MAKFADHMEKIESGVVEGYKKIEDGVANIIIDNERGTLKWKPDLMFSGT